MSAAVMMMVSVASMGASATQRAKCYGTISY